MLPSFAVNKQWVIPSIKDNFKSLANCIIRNVDKRLLASVYPELEEPDPVRPQEVRIRLRVRLRAQAQNGAEPQALQEAEVGGVGVPRPEDAVVDHREVQRRDEELLAAGVVAGADLAGGGVVLDQLSSVLLVVALALDLLL